MTATVLIVRGPIPLTACRASRPQRGTSGVRWLAGLAAYAQCVAVIALLGDAPIACLSQRRGFDGLSD
jgi:hypothetical protein